MRWRSPPEIGFRVKQEARNLALLLSAPKLPSEPGFRLEALPAPQSAAACLRESRTAAVIVALADEILAHRLRLFDVEIDAGPEIRWRRDYLSRRETEAVYFRRVPYLDFDRVGDHKVIWELNRHQHLVVLAQAHLLTGRADHVAEIGRQWESWLLANPFPRGINWTSALEVALRALSWIWILHLIGDRLTSAVRRSIAEGLYRHGMYLAANLSVYFSPNTHLLGEAVALHALGLLFRGVKGTEAWEQTGARVTAEQMERQVLADGSHFELSSYYHVYALDMLLFHAVLRPPGSSYRESLGRMAGYLDALMGPSRSLPPMGDDDGGRFFHPYGPRDRFGRATLATCGVLLNRPEWIGDPEDLEEQAAWWLAPAAPKPGNRPRESRWFSNAGIATLENGVAHCVVDAGAFGPFQAGHSHADALSCVVRLGGQDLLIDPGTFTYVADRRARDAFRGTAAHNTVRLQELDQADPSGPFGWRNPPQVALRQWHSARDLDYLDAECHYRGLRHRRRILFIKPEWLVFLDEAEGAELAAEQFWHSGGAVETMAPSCFRIAGAGTLVLALAGSAADLSIGGRFGWRSPVYGVREPAPVIVSRRQGSGVVRFGAALAFKLLDSPPTLEVLPASAGVQMALRGPGGWVFEFGELGLPRRVT